jgi:hypothetical protein
LKNYYGFIDGEAKRTVSGYELFDKNVKCKMTGRSDMDFQKAKLIKQGRAEINADFKPLADWIYKTYGVKPIDINYTIQCSRPTLEIALEFIRDKEKFKSPDNFSYDGEKQFAISKQFMEIANNHIVTERWGPFNLFSRQRDKYNTQDLLVAFSRLSPLQWARQPIIFTVTRSTI